MQFKPALIVYGPDNGDLFRVILFYKYVDLEIAVVLCVTRRDLFRQLALGETSGLNLGVDERHADHAVAFDSYCFA